MNVFPLYLLRLGKSWRIVFPVDRADIGHTTFWEQTASHIVADHYRVPQAKIANLPYCQRRARVVGSTIYYGEKHDPKLLRLIRQAVGDHELAFCHDEHECRLREDIAELRKVLACYRPRAK